MGLHYSTINATIVKYQTSPTGTSTSCSGRIKILSNANREYIHFFIKRDPFMKNRSYLQIT